MIRRCPLLTSRDPSIFHYFNEQLSAPRIQTSILEQLVFQCFEFVEIGDNCRDAESLTFRAKVELHLSTAKPNARKKANYSKA